MVMDQVKQIDQNQDNNINTQELLDAMKQNGFLSNENNLEEVWKLLSNEELSEEDKALVDSLKSTIDNEINTILEKWTATEEDIMLINVRKELLWENDDRVQRLDEIINDINRSNINIEQDNQEIDITLILQELDNEIETALNSPLNNLQELWIDISLQNNRKWLWILWANILNNIKNLDDLWNITKENVNTYLNIPNNVPKENYGYIAENLKNILYTHLAIHPERKAILQKWWYSSWMSLKTTRENDKYEANLHRQIQKLQEKSLDEQVNLLVKNLPNNSDLLDLWLKTTLNQKDDNWKKKYKQNTVLTKIFDKIPIDQSNKFFKACENNSFINELKNNYALYWLNKNNSIKTWNWKYCFLDRKNKSKFNNLLGKWIKLSEKLSFDQLYNHTKDFYKNIEKFWFDSSIPLDEIIKFLNSQSQSYQKIKKASSICEREIKSTVDSYSNMWWYVSMWWSAGAGRAYLSWEIHASKVKFKSEKSKACAELEKEYVKVLLQKKQKPVWEIMWISWAWIKLNFNKDPWKGSLDARADKIVRDTFTEKLWDQREKFKYDLKYDRQAAFGSALWMIWWIAWATAATIFSWNILATSAWFTAWLRLWNWIWQELWNSWEYLYEQISWNTIDDWNNGVQSFWQWFLRWVWALDQNYEYVWTAKFLSWLWFDYLSTVATFWLSQKFWWFLWKLEWVKFAWWALKFGMEELILENFFVDIPMNIVQTWFETFTGIDDWITIWNTAIWNQHTVEWQWGYKSGSISDMLRAMKDATSQNLSFENLSQTFFNTIIYWWFLEWWWAAIKKMKWYLPAGQVSNFTERSAAASAAFLWLTNFMSSKNINFNKDWVCIDTKTNQKIEESDSRFQELCTHLNAVEATKAWVIESFESIMETQKQMVSDPENKTWLLFRLWLISPTNTPLNILKKKKELVEKKLNKAKSKWDNKIVEQLQKLLDIYTDAENKLYIIWTDVYLKTEKWVEIRTKVESYDPSTNEYTVIWEEEWKSKRKRVTEENLRSPMNTEYFLDKWNWIRRYKTELATEKLNETHIQETENILNELITESDKQKLNQKRFESEKEYPDEQCEKDVQKFIKQSKEKEIAHKQIFIDLGKEANAQALFIWPPKKADRIVDKVKNEYLAEWEGWLENITDFTRSTLLFNNYSEFVKWIEILKQMQKEWRITKLRIKNRINTPWCNDMLINIETADWYVSEVQFHIPETLILKDGFLWPQVEILYKERFSIEFDKYIFIEEIYDLKLDNEYLNKKNRYEEIINKINEIKEKNFKFPEQWKEIHGHDVYDIKRILDTWEKDPELSLQADLEDVTSLKGILQRISDALADEARRRYGNRTILQ